MDLDTDFEKILNEYRENDYPHEKVYHYTNAAALLGMLETKEFWLTDYRYLNDPSEIAYALEQIFSLVNEFQEKHALRNLDSSFFKKVRESIKKYYNFYIFSLCKYQNYLPAWRWYGNNGAGFAVGFKPNSLPQSTENDTTYPIWFKCSYEKDEYKSFLEKLLIQNKKYKLKDLVYCLMHLMPKIKHIGYKEENEYRLCILEENILAERRVSVPSEKKFWRDSRTTTDPYVNTIPLVKWPFNQESLCEIWVGPRCNYEHAKNDLEKILQKHNFKNVEIKKSEIPYRL